MAQQKPPGIDAAELRRRRGEGGRFTGQVSRTLFSRPTSATTLKPVVRRFKAKLKDPMLLPGKHLTGRQQIFFGPRTHKHEGGLKSTRGK